MRLNIRLMGLLFGLLAIAMIGRIVLGSAPAAAIRKKAVPVVLVALRGADHRLHRIVLRSLDSGGRVSQSGVAGGRVGGAVHARSRRLAGCAGENRRGVRRLEDRQSGSGRSGAHVVRARHEPVLRHASAAGRAARRPSIHASTPKSSSARGQELVARGRAGQGGSNAETNIRGTAGVDDQRAGRGRGRGSRRPIPARFICRLARDIRKSLPGAIVVARRSSAIRRGAVAGAGARYQYRSRERQRQFIGQQIEPSDGGRASGQLLERRRWARTRTAHAGAVARDSSAPAADSR